MSKSDSLRVRDIRAAFRLIGDCRDLGNDPRRWQRRMLEGLVLLFGVVQASGGEAWWERPGKTVRPVSAYTMSVDPAAEAAFQAYHSAGGPAGDPILQEIEKRPQRLITRTRRELVSDGEWYSSPSFAYRRAGGIDHTMVSVLQRSESGATSVVALNRARGERDFTAREQRLLHLFHAELGQLIGGPLVGATDPPLDPLPRRLQQTLACLLEGDSEKQVAARLGLSHATVHQYVTALYRRFGVQSRGQLMSYVLQHTRRSV
jgi:DNA-binding CsgD family transcriptional regulator